MLAKGVTLSTSTRFAIPKQCAVLANSTAFAAFLAVVPLFPVNTESSYANFAFGFLQAMKANRGHATGLAITLEFVVRAHVGPVAVSAVTLVLAVFAEASPSTFFATVP